MVKHTYEYINALFREAGCQFLETEEDFKTKNIIYNSIVRFVSKCGHNNTVTLNNFVHYKNGVLCKDCVKNVIREKVLNYQKQDKDDFSSMNQYQEHNGYLKLATYLQEKFDIVKTKEGCLADFLVRPKGTTRDEWLMVQLKTTQSKCRHLYGFSFKHSNYHNCCIVLLCIEDAKIWLLRNEDIKVKCKINIGLTKKSEYFKYQVTPKKLNKELLKGYTELELVTQKEGLTPQQQYQKREQEYFKYREECFPYLKIEYPEGDGLVYDLSINGLHVQDKVISRSKKNSGYTLRLTRKHMKNNDKIKYNTYKKGDNQYYWIWLNKEIFYLFPEAVLIEKGYIEKILFKFPSLYLYPHFKKEQFHKIKTGWANNYMYRVSEVTEQTFQDLGLLS